MVDDEADLSSSAHTGQKKQQNNVETQNSLGLVLRVAGLFLPLTPDLLTVPGFLQYTGLYCRFTLRAAQLNICIGIEFLCPKCRVGSIQLPEILECFSSRRRLVSRAYKSLTPRYKIVIYSFYVLFVGRIVHLFGGNVFATFLFCNIIISAFFYFIFFNY